MTSREEMSLSQLSAQREQEAPPGSSHQSKLSHRSQSITERPPLKVEEQVQSKPPPPPEPAKSFEGDRPLPVHKPKQTPKEEDAMAAKPKTKSQALTRAYTHHFPVFSSVLIPSANIHSCRTNPRGQETGGSTFHQLVWRKGDH
jgi:hypothetical protein